MMNIMKIDGQLYKSLVLKGAENLKRVLEFARKSGVKVVTLYAFSSENWSRPKEEVDTLMNLFREYLKNDIQELIKEGVRVSFIGEREKFDKSFLNEVIVTIKKLFN